MSATPRQITEIQVRAWLNAMRKLWVRRNGIDRGECIVPTWEELIQADRQILILAMEAAMSAGTPENVARVLEGS